MSTMQIVATDTSASASRCGQSVVEAGSSMTVGRVWADLADGVSGEPSITLPMAGVVEAGGLGLRVKS
jgi:hypothetical protein